MMRCRLLNPNGTTAAFIPNAAPALLNRPITRLVFEPPLRSELTQLDNVSEIICLRAEDGNLRSTTQLKIEEAETLSSMLNLNGGFVA